MNTTKNIITNAAFLPLDQVTKPGLTTKEAAYYFDRKEQTLRVWAMQENGLVRPLRINNRLVWPTKKIKKLLGVEV